jgi:hypothetical protein
MASCWDSAGIIAYRGLREAAGGAADDAARPILLGRRPRGGAISVSTKSW